MANSPKKDESLNNIYAHFAQTIDPALLAAYARAQAAFDKAEEAIQKVEDAMTLAETEIAKAEKNLKKIAKMPEAKRVKYAEKEAKFKGQLERMKSTLENTLTGGLKTAKANREFSAAKRSEFEEQILSSVGGGLKR